MLAIVIKQTVTEEKPNDSVLLNNFLFAAGGTKLFIKNKQTNEIAALCAGKTYFYRGPLSIFSDLICDEIDDDYAMVLQTVTFTLNDQQLKSLNVFLSK